MRLYPSPDQAELLKLPVIISDAAWLQAVHIHDFMFDELSSRLTALIRNAYQALIQTPTSGYNQPISFALLVLPASGEREGQVWLDLRLLIEPKGGVPNLLKIDVASP